VAGSLTRRGARIVRPEVEAKGNCSVITSLAKLAPQSFGFLEASYGFRRVLSNEAAVRWETDGVFVQVRYDAHRSYEVGLEIGQLTAEAARLGPTFSLGEVLGLAGFPLADRPFYQASTEERLKTAIEGIARLLAQHGTPLLRNDADVFRSLAQQRDKDGKSYAEERTLKRMRSAADKAWHEHDYRAVVDLYREQIRHLTPAEAKRYEIAARHIGTPIQ
jgi:hypothetical protein